MVDQWQLEKLALTQLRNELFFYTPGVSRLQLGPLAGRSYATLDEAIAAVLQGVLPDARVALVPDGPYVFARVSP